MSFIKKHIASTCIVIFIFIHYRLIEDIRNRLQEILGVIGKQDTTGPKSSEKVVKFDTTSKDLVADLSYVCSWIKDRYVIQPNEGKRVIIKHF